MYPAFLLAVVVVVHMRTAICGIVDDQACAKHVHEECKCNISYDFSKKIQAEHLLHICKNIQSCADCMDRPRCQSSYVDRYTVLLDFLISIIIKEKFCPQTPFYLATRKICNENRKVYDHCGSRCDCQNEGYANCFRVRKEFTQMSFEERRQFVDAYYKATTDPLLKDDFQKILSARELFPTDYLHHMPQIFFPWHRWFLLQAENFLRQIDCRVTIPYYQWTAAGKNAFRTTNPRDVWSSGPQGIGGNGVPPDYCVMDGKFRKGNWRLPFSKGGGCLKRDFSKTCKFYKEKQLHKLLESKSFNYFERIVRKKLNNAFHVCTGGNVQSSRMAGNTPEVLLHYSFMDKIWDQWQNKGDLFKYQYFPSINFKMPRADMYPWQLLDNSNLPGSVRVVYQKFKEPSQQNKVKDIEGEEIWEDEGNLTDEENFTDEQPENDRELPDEQADGNVED